MGYGNPLAVAAATLSARDEKFVIALIDELKKARHKFPGIAMNLPAFVEEVGELSKSLMENRRTGGASHDDLDVWKEAVQCAVMACRIATEGDSDFTYDPAVAERRFDEGRSQ